MGQHICIHHAPHDSDVGKIVWMWRECIINDVYINMCSRWVKLKGHYRHAMLKSAKHAEVVGNIVCVVRLKGPEHVRWHAFNKEATRVAWHAFACISDVSDWRNDQWYWIRNPRNSGVREGVLSTIWSSALCAWQNHPNKLVCMFSLSQTKHKLDSVHVQFESNSTQSWPQTYSVWVKPNTHLTTHMFTLSQTKHNTVKLYVQFELKWTQTWQHHVQFSSRTGGLLMTSRALASHICSQHNLSSWYHQDDNQDAFPV